MQGAMYLRLFGPHAGCNAVTLADSHWKLVDIFQRPLYYGHRSPTYDREQQRASLVRTIITIVDARPNAPQILTSYAMTVVPPPRWV